MIYNWGNYPKPVNQEVAQLNWVDAIDFESYSKVVLPHGNGRSYGDSCLNDNGILLETTNLDHFIAFDPIQGILRCESGVLLADILPIVIPQGWILPVMPGTKFVTVGGAVANDVHGKNHHRVGTFGCHIVQFELMRSDGSRVVCSKEENKQLFSATIGGLGLTGIITWVELQLKPIKSAFLDVTTIPFHGLKEFYQLSQQAEEQYEYTVAWLDCQSQNKNFARGLFIGANHADVTNTKTPKKNSKKIPFYFPQLILNRWTISLFNKLYYHLGKRKKQRIDYYDPYFFPLDSILQWNKIYGKKGFLQYQFVLPEGELATLEIILKKITKSGFGSFLSVLKTFGAIQSPGLLSFPRSGLTLALDFPNRPEVFKLLTELDTIVMQAGGRVYPAKDARMSATAFQQYYPQYKEFEQYIDPKFSSSFWRRVTNGETE